MKITKIKIKNLYGITEYEGDGKSVELSGTNGAGKSSVIDAIDTTSWRDDTGRILRKIGMECGDSKSYQDVRAESYQLLEKRMGVNVKQRLTNKRRRMADEGVCKSRRDKLNYLDVIADDKKLIEGYTAIVKELAIKHGVA